MRIGDIKKTRSEILSYLLVDCDNEKCYTKKTFQKVTGADFQTVTKAIKQLKQEKIIETVTAYNVSNGRLNGKGYVLREALLW